MAGKKEDVKRLEILHQQKGQVLVILLIMLAVGSLIIPATLAAAGSGFKVQGKVEQRTDELYAADVGIQSALWWLKSTPYSNLPTNPAVVIEFPPSGVLSVNGEKVFAFFQYVNTVSEPHGYRITSLAGPAVIHDTNLANQPSGYSKIITFVTVSSCDLTGIMNQVITSQNGYTVQGGQGTLNPPSGDHSACANYTGSWPTADQLYQFYWQQVMNTIPYSSNSVSVQNTPSLGPFYRNGTLDIENSGASGATLTLHGPLFINGNTTIGMNGQQFNINLNGQTIYINSNTVGLPYALQVGSKCTIKGNGAIIVLGDIQFKPSIGSGPGDYLFVMSVAGMTYLQPGGAFYGTVAGSTTVYDQNGSLTWVDPTGTSLNVPGIGSGTFWGIKTWDITLR